MSRRRAHSAGEQQGAVAPHERVGELEQEVAHLRESLGRYRDLFEQSPDASYVCDLRGTFVDGNAAAEALSGYARADLIGKSFLTLGLLSTADLVRATSLLARNALGKSTGPDEFTLRRKDGTSIPVEIETRPLTIGSRRLVLANARDISARHLAQRRAQVRTKELQAFFRLAEIDHTEGITLEGLCREFVAFLPQSWQYSEIACARIRIGESEFRTANYAEPLQRQSAPIVVFEVVSGEIEVAYREEKPDADEGPFLREERLLIDALAERLGRIAERILAEKTLRDNEERLALVVDAAQLGIYDVDLRSGATYCSPEYSAMLGYGPDEVDTSPGSGAWESLLHPDDRDRTLAALDRHLRGEIESYDVEFRLRAKAGDWRWVRSRGRVVARDGTGRALRLVGTHADIDQRRRAQNALRDSEARFRALSENALAGVYIVQDGHLTYVNRALARIFGYEPAELIGASPLAVIHPDDHALVTENIRPRIAGEVESLQYEFRGLCKNGEVKVIEVYGAGTEIGGRPAIVGNTLDVTERKRAEAALRESEDRYRRLVDNVPGVIFTMDAGGKITFASQRIAGMLGYESAEVVGRSVLDFIPEGERPRAMDGIREGMAGVGIKHFETPMIKRSGERMWLECSFARIRRDGAVVGVQGTAIDITERKRAEEALRASERNARSMAEELGTVGRVGAAIIAGLDLERLMETLYEQCRSLFPIDTFYVVLHDAGTNTVSFPFMYKDGARRSLPARSLDQEPGLAAHVIHGRRTVYLPEASRSSIAMVRQPGTVNESIVAVPMTLGDRVIGLLSMQAKSQNAYSQEQIQMFERLALQVAIAISNSRLYESVTRGLDATLDALGRIAEKRDPYTAGHQRRVTELALAIARKLAYGEVPCSTLRTAGMLHDIGKLGVPAEILSKPTALSKIEMQLIRAHPQEAYEILADIAFPGPVAEIVLQHHERQDGSGYPKGIGGDTVLPEARILAVADVVEAMASHRPYRPALGIPAALDEIRAGRGTRYDPQIVDACVALFESGEFAFSPSVQK
jgi:PAS domain S-box-containing protein/putative nucleotidyltransferase with HDIG domain